MALAKALCRPSAGLRRPRPLRCGADGARPSRGVKLSPPRCTRLQTCGLRAAQCTRRRTHRTACLGRGGRERRALAAGELLLGNVCLARRVLKRGAADYLIAPAHRARIHTPITHRVVGCVRLHDAVLLETQHRCVLFCVCIWALTRCRARGRIRIRISIDIRMLLRPPKQ